MDMGYKRVTMNGTICLDERFSTTRRLVLLDPGAPGHPLVARPGVLCGGLRSRGFAKCPAADYPLLTVVTVVRNDGPGLKKTIESVSGQTYPNIEYIVIDGGSTDATRSVLQEYDHLVDFWQSEPDAGIYDAMNKGLALAGGEWISFMNAQDYFYQADSVQKALTGVPADSDFIYGHTYFLGGDAVGVVKALGFERLWRTMIFTHQALFTRTALLKERPFDTGFKICADYNFIFNAYMTGKKFFHSGQVIACFSPGKSEISRARMAYEKWRVVRRFRHDFTFHWFYLRLFIKRLFRDIFRRFKPVGGG